LPRTELTVQVPNEFTMKVEQFFDHTGGTLGTRSFVAESTLGPGSPGSTELSVGPGLASPVRSDYQAQFSIAGQQFVVRKDSDRVADGTGQGDRGFDGEKVYAGLGSGVRHREGGGVGEVVGR
jgi:hypothetical protein